jgi:hypothetical protein
MAEDGSRADMRTMFVVFRLTDKEAKVHVVERGKRCQAQVRDKQ